VLVCVTLGVCVTLDVWVWLHVCDVVCILLTGANAMPRKASFGIELLDVGTTEYDTDGLLDRNRTTAFGEEADPAM